MGITSFLIRDLTPIERDVFDERTAIMEYDGLVSRQDTEQLAYEEIMKIRTAKASLDAAGRKAA